MKYKIEESEAVERLKSHRIFMQRNDCYAKENYNKFGELALEANKMGIKALEEIQQYRAIGTIEECREARERQMPKKPTFLMDFNDFESLFACGCGKTIVVRHNKGTMDDNDASNYCSNCGSKLDWKK